MFDSIVRSKDIALKYPMYEAYRLKELAEWNYVKQVYTRMICVRRVLTKYARQYILKKCLKNTKNSNDVATLEPPKQCVRVIDYKGRFSYIYEASSLRRSIDERLTYSEFMIPSSKSPTNPFSNLPFTLGQMISAFQQCRVYGQYSWSMAGFVKYRYNVRQFHLHFFQPLKIYAIETFFNGPFYEYRDDLLDLFDMESEALEIPIETVRIFKRLLNLKPDCELIREWIRIVKRTCIAKELEDTMEITKLSYQIRMFFRKLHHTGYINL